MALLVNKAELARLFNVSEPTVGKWLVEVPAVPVVSGGSNGIAYEFDVDQVKAWHEARATRQREAEQDREQQLRAAQAELFGAGTPLVPEGVSQDDVKTYLENVRLHDEISRRRGESILRADVRNEFQAVLQVFRQHVLGFATTLARTANLTPEQQRAAEALGKQTLDACWRQIRDPDLRPPAPVDMSDGNAPA